MLITKGAIFTHYYKFHTEGKMLVLHIYMSLITQHTHWGHRLGFWAWQWAHLAETWTGPLHPASQCLWIFMWVCKVSLQWRKEKTRYAAVLQCRVIGRIQESSEGQRCCLAKLLFFCGEKCGKNWWHQILAPLLPYAFQNLFWSVGPFQNCSTDFSFPSSFKF